MPNSIYGRLAAATGRRKESKSGSSPTLNVLKDLHRS